LKQMKLIYAQGFSKNERLEWKPVVFNNVVQSMRLIFDVMNDQSIEFENKENEVRKHLFCKQFNTRSYAQAAISFSWPGLLVRN
jgi:guanine nucleotide-binding protein subunit alpha